MHVVQQHPATLPLQAVLLRFVIKEEQPYDAFDEATAEQRTSALGSLSKEISKAAKKAGAPSLPSALCPVRAASRMNACMQHEQAAFSLASTTRPPTRDVGRAFLAVVSACRQRALCLRRRSRPMRLTCSCSVQALLAWLLLNACVRACTCLLCLQRT